MDLAEHLLLVGAELKPLLAADEVDGPVGQRDRSGVAASPLDRPVDGGRDREHALVEVDSDDAPGATYQGPGSSRDHPGAARQVEDPSPGPWRSQVEQLFRTRLEERRHQQLLVGERGVALELERLASRTQTGSGEMFWLTWKAFSGS